MNLKEVAKINTSNSERGERNLKGNLKQMVANLSGDRGKEDMDVMLGLINKKRKEDGESKLSLKELIKIVNET